MTLRLSIHMVSVRSRVFCEMIKPEYHKQQPDKKYVGFATNEGHAHKLLTFIHVSEYTLVHQTCALSVCTYSTQVPLMVAWAAKRLTTFVAVTADKADCFLKQ